MDTSYREGFIGDTIVFTLPLKRMDGTDFEPGDTHALIFTAKASDADEDSAAILQVASGAGITVSSSLATITIAPAATADLSPATLTCDVQAQHSGTGAVTTVAYAKLQLRRDITRSTQTSVPVLTDNPAVPFGPPFTVTDGDDLEIIHNGITYYVPLFRRA